MSQYQNHRRCAPILIEFESKIPSLMFLSVPMDLIDRDMLRALWRTSKTISYFKFSSIFTKCSRTNESYVPFVILSWCKWIELCHSKVWVWAVMGTDGRHWLLHKVDEKLKKTCSKTDGKLNWRNFSIILWWQIMDPWLSFFTCLINLTHDLMKNFISLNVHLYSYFIVRLDIHFFNHFCCYLDGCDDNFCTDVRVFLSA